MKYLKKWNSINEGSDIDRTFVCFGKLGLIKQKGFGSESFHAPPAQLGFYAMPKRFQELFLIGSLDKTQAKYLGYPKEPDWDTASDEEVETYHKKRKTRFKAIRHEFEIPIETEFLHHLDTPHNEVISSHGTWVKTNYKAWKKALSKESVKLRAQSLAPWPRTKTGEKNYQPGGINSINKRSGAYSKDHFEVFFDTKVI